MGSHVIKNCNFISDSVDVCVNDCKVEKRQMIIAVCGVKNSGKTTLLTKMVEMLSKKGIKVAVIKHDGHDFSCDVEGTDSDKLSKAGAYGVAVFSKNRIFVHKQLDRDREIERELEQELIKQFPEAEIIFLEGMKNSEYCKIEVIRKEISKEPVSNPKGRFLIATDWDLGCFQETAININDVDGIIQIIEDL